jgi:hypothetical protein
MTYPEFCVLAAESTPISLQEFGLVGSVVVSILGGLGLMLRWLTSYVSKKEEMFRDERKEERETWQVVAREWKECHRDTCQNMNQALKELTEAIRHESKGH